MTSSKNYKELSSALIPNTTLQPAFATQLPEYLLHSDRWYMTAEGYAVLLNFCDDDNIIEAQQNNQYSMAVDEFLDLEIDRLFKKNGCPDVFSGEALEELRSYISQKLAGLNLNTIIIR